MEERGKTRCIYAIHIYKIQHKTQSLSLCIYIHTINTYKIQYKTLCIYTVHMKCKCDLEFAEKIIK